jgi:tyrosyl-tRNA synthetase
VSDPAFWQELKDREFIFQETSDLGAWLGKRRTSGERVSAYIGFDPTASSLHVGSLLPAIGLRRLRQVGIQPIAVVGGATGMIGDPSGKAQERVLLDGDQIQQNLEGIRAQLESLLEGDAGKDFLLVNNGDWFASIGYIDFLRNVGKHFSVNAMMAKESVRARLEDRDQGISYTEFSYMLLQAYDFLHLFETHGCQLQCGGSDQWGNITAGIDLIRHKHHGAEVHGCTFPLLTTASGQKFGKSERGAIWIDPRRTHPYFVYKYFFDVADADVIRLLKLMTFVPMAEVRSLADQVASEPQKREAQRRLAREVTGLVHGLSVSAACEGLETSMHADDVDAFEQHARTLGLLNPADLPADVDRASLPVLHCALAQLEGPGLSVIDLAVEAGLYTSKSDVRRDIQSGSGGLRIGGEAVGDITDVLTRATLGDRRVLQIRRGKRNKRMIVFH